MMKCATAALDVLGKAQSKRGLLEYRSVGYFFAFFTGACSNVKTTFRFHKMINLAFCAVITICK